MAKSQCQKLKLLYLRDILLKKTDDAHTITVPQMIDELARAGINAERKSIYSDIESLNEYGMDIIKSKSKTVDYSVANRIFELAELKLLVDAVQCSKFITHKKTMVLIDKLESFASEYEANLLKRTVFVSGRVKSENNSILINTDAIHTAINQNTKILFQYFEWTVDKERRFKKLGEKYKISPWGLTWDDGNYYMIGFDESENLLKHYRVDKMQNISLTTESRDGAQEFEKFDIALYMKKTFGMFGGKPESVELIFKNSLAGVVIDRFGKDITIIKHDDESFKIKVEVYISKQFAAWLAGFGSSVRVVSPQSVIDLLCDNCRDILSQYTDN